MKVIACIGDPLVIKKILSHLHGKALGLDAAGVPEKSVTAGSLVQPTYTCKGQRSPYHIIVHNEQVKAPIVSDAEGPKVAASCLLEKIRSKSRSENLLKIQNGHIKQMQQVNGFSKLTSGKLATSFQVDILNAFML